jgi:inner membrane protein involved in colicin E2 resistance
MITFIKFLIVLCSLVIFIQDLKFRGVSWILFPIIFILCSIYNFIQLPALELVCNFGYNLIFLTILFFFVMIYFSIKNRKFVNITKELIGAGDLLFFVCLSALFSPINFILFFISSLLIITLVSGLIILIIKNKKLQIPLAGLQAIFLGILIMITHCIPYILINKDEWVLMVL